MLFSYMMPSPYGLLCAPTAQQSQEPEGSEEECDEQNPLDMIRDPFHRNHSRYSAGVKLPRALRQSSADH